MDCKYYVSKKRFNRTTVECKYDYQDVILWRWIWFNRTTVECKFWHWVLKWLKSLRFNRTTVECKWNIRAYQSSY